MSGSKNPILRDVSGVSDFDLPKWDRKGNDVSKKEALKVEEPVVQTVTSDIEEEVISAPTVKELEQIREDAYNDGFEQGFEQGLKQGKAEGNAQGIKEGTEQGHKEGFAKGIEQGQTQALQDSKAATEKSLAVFQNISDELISYRTNDEQEFEDALGALSLKIARQVLQDELRIQPSHISNLVHSAVQALPDPDQKLSIRLNPEDLEFVESISDTHWDLISDETISRGGCTVKSGYSYIDFTLEQRFDLTVKQILNNLPATKDTEQFKKPISEDPLVDDKLEAQRIDNTGDEAQDIGQQKEKFKQAISDPVMSESTPEPEITHHAELQEGADHVAAEQQNSSDVAEHSGEVDPEKRSDDD